MNLSLALLNLQSGIGVTRGYQQYVTKGMRYIMPHSGEALTHAATFLSDQHIDLALLTEVEGGSRRSQYVSQLDILREKSQIPEGRFFPTRSLGNSINEGNGILSRYPLERVVMHPLPSATNPRVLGETRITIEDRTLTVCVVHLALRSETRRLQIDKVVELLKDIHTPILLGGDFNERDIKQLHALTDIGLSFVTAPGYPSWKPLHSLQVLFYSKEFEVVSVSTDTETLFSDHLPLTVELTF
ncbi:endonuclease/exonuclease/phosphatase family protein [Patescibacteria group bacterium]|nr:endonuclease/exonuclease/phosphatase family protein [Patescibacteria group bacterium]MBU2220727.1 endonuclease/exonuclease/phosphatase family protein [Patescibacteria group bacterium]